ncbi:MAG TPA: hypothetical protein VGP35_07240, partial [Terriglobales bacterium]|nr:hypothetical protein [Terriglobales bacterium]
VKLIRGLSSTSKAEDLWTTRLGTAYCQPILFSLIVVALCAMQNSSHLLTEVIGPCAGYGVISKTTPQPPPPKQVEPPPVSVVPYRFPFVSKISPAAGRGRARMRAGSEDQSVSEGSIIFVAAGVDHRFYEITEELVLLVFFAPAETE